MDRTRDCGSRNLGSIPSGGTFLSSFYFYGIIFIVHNSLKVFSFVIALVDRICICGKIKIYIIKLIILPQFLRNRDVTNKICKAIKA